MFFQLNGVLHCQYYRHFKCLNEPNTSVHESAINALAVLWKFLGQVRVGPFLACLSLDILEMVKEVSKIELTRSQEGKEQLLQMIRELQAQLKLQKDGQTWVWYRWQDASPTSTPGWSWMRKI